MMILKTIRMKTKTKSVKKIVTVDSTEKSKTNIGLKALTKAFNSDIEDTELFERYVHFNKNVEFYREKHNDLVAQINEKLKIFHILKESVLDQVMQGVLSSEAISKLKDLEVEIENLKSSISDYREKLDYNKKLSENYKSTSEDRLFVWWKAFKAVDPKNTPSWIDWKTKYAENII